MQVDQIKKRDGRIVPFDRARIENAIGKAYFSTLGQPAPAELAITITDGVAAVLEERFPVTIPGVEDVQDIVERKLAEAGLFEVAKHYILYRQEHQKIREERRQEMLERVEKSQLRVVKRDGSSADFDLAEIGRAVKNVAADFGDAVVVDEIVADAKRGIFDGITTRDINQVVLIAFRARIERDYAYSLAAARFLYNDLYKDILGIDEFEDGFARRYHQLFRHQIEKGITAGRLDPRLGAFDLEKLSAALMPERDRLFAYLGAQTLYDRYFVRTSSQEILEVPQYFWMRIAMGLAIDEKHREETAIKFYQTISSLRYVPSTPTLFHAGTHHPQMSSCYISTVEDDLTHIFKSIGDNAQLSKWSGGLGNDWTNIRGTGSLIKSTNVGSQGVIPFLKIVDSTTAAINRSGKRRGALCAYLETWHYDIEDFLELRKNTGDDRRRTHDINTAHWIPDLFLKRVLHNEDWTLFSPDETPDLHHIYGRQFEVRYKEYEAAAERGEIKLTKKLKAVDLWRRMITMLFETGHPWVTFKDPINIRSPQDHVGVVHSSNLCTEITLNTSADETAVCNLGSVNLPRHIENGRLNWEEMAQTVSVAMRMLDNVIDLNYYPTPEAKNANMRHRPVGLGIMGFQDLLYQLGYNFDSEKAVTLSDQVMEFISYYAILTSSHLSREKGVYSTYKGSKWDRGLFPIDTVKLLEDERGIPTGLTLTGALDWQLVREHVASHGMRNSNCLAIAPTATIANISGCFPSIEPIYKNLYVKSNFSGEFTVVNHYLIAELKKLHLWNDQMMERLKYYEGSVQRIVELPEELRGRYKEVFEIDAHWIVRHGAARAKWLDQSQSVNIFTTSHSGKFISDVYITAWKMGMKTTYYLRTLAATSIEQSTIDINKKHDNQPTGAEIQSAASGAPLATETLTVAEAPVVTDGPSRAPSLTQELITDRAVATDTAIATAELPLPDVKPAPSATAELPLADQKPATTTDVADKPLVPRVCLIDDPDCEACQ